MYCTKNLHSLEQIKEVLFDAEKCCFMGQIGSICTMEEIFEAFSMLWLKTRQSMRKKDKLIKLYKSITSSSSSSSFGTSPTSPFSSKSSKLSAVSKLGGSVKGRQLQLILKGAPLAAIRTADPKTYFARFQQIRDLWISIRNTKSVPQPQCAPIPGTVSVVSSLTLSILSLFL